MNLKTRKTVLASIVTTSIFSMAFSGLTAAEQANYLKLPELSAPTLPSSQAVSKRFIVKFKDNNSLNLNSPLGATLLEQRAANLELLGSNLEKGGNKVHNKLVRQNALSVELTDSQVAKLRSNANVDYIEEDPERRLMSLNLGEITPWGLAPVQALGTLGDQANSGIKVCIIDTGYDNGHPDLQTSGVDGQGNVSTGLWSSPGNSHGTHVAGTIAGIANNGDGVVGIFPNQQADIYVYKIFDNNGSWPRASDIITAAQACADNGSKVINMSLGGSGSSTTEANAFSSLLSQGVLSIAAAGNDGNTSHSYPASYNDVISVAATDNNNDHAYFSQRTNQVELSGPGVAVRSTVIRGDGRGADLVVNGTSYADQHVLPHLRYISSGGSYVPSPADGSVTGNLFHCDTQSGSADCSGANNNICLVERTADESSGVYPEIDAISACANAGGIGAIVYSTSSLPGLQSNYVLDQSNAYSMPSVSVDRATGLALAAQAGQSTTVTTQSGGNYEYYNGTSMATPHVVGAAALVWSYHQSCSATEIRSALRATALDLHTSGRDNYTGYGLVQAQAAVDYLNTNGCSGSGNGGGNGEVTSITETDLSARRRNWLYYTIDVPAGATKITATLNGGSGDADLYLNLGSDPSTSNYDCISESYSNQESCEINAPASGTWHIGIRAYRTFSGVTLNVDVTE